MPSNGEILKNYYAAVVTRDISAARGYLLRTETAAWNYSKQTPGSTEVVGISVFCQDPDGQISHTYSCFQRGVDMMNGAYHYMGLAPKGRDEADQGPTMAWLRRHDEYED